AGVVDDGGEGELRGVGLEVADAGAVEAGGDPAGADVGEVGEAAIPGGVAADEDVFTCAAVEIVSAAAAHADVAAVVAGDGVGRAVDISAVHGGEVPGVGDIGGDESIVGVAAAEVGLQAAEAGDGGCGGSLEVDVDHKGAGGVIEGIGAARSDQRAGDGAGIV